MLIDLAGAEPYDADELERRVDKFNNPPRDEVLERELEGLRFYFEGLRRFGSIVLREGGK